MEELEIIEKLRSFYKNKNVLLTGHTGFKGSWMLVLLEYLGANVTGYALEPLHEKDLYNAIDGNRLCDSHILEIVLLTGYSQTLFFILPHRRLSVNLIGYRLKHLK